MRRAKLSTSASTGWRSLRWSCPPSGCWRSSRRSVSCEPCVPCARSVSCASCAGDPPRPEDERQPRASW